MRARCYHCQNAFDTDRFGVQRCPSCGTEVYLPDPAAAQGQPAPPPAGGEAPPTPQASPDAPAQPQQPPPGAPPPWGAPPPAWGAAPGQPPPGWGPPPGWPPPPGWGPIPPGALPPIAEQDSPFAERGRRGFVASYLETWRLAATEPARFFRQVRATPGPAVLFGVVSVTLGTWVSLVFRYLTASATVNFVGQITRRMGGRVETFPFSQVFQGLTAGAFAAQLALAPLFVLAGLYLTAAIFHLLLLLVRGSSRGFDATLTVVGYASGIMLLEALPVCGGLVALPWFLVVAITGLSEAQRCGGGKAAFAVLMPLVLSCVCACLGGAALVPFMGDVFKTGPGPRGTGI